MPQWRAEFTNDKTLRLWLGESIAAHVVEGPDGWRVRPNIAGRKGSRRGYVGCAAAAIVYFSKHANEVHDAILIAHENRRAQQSQASHPEATQ
ncbi:MAG TPA: hypothetical protein PKE16_16405 [Hyphomicrobium sp.]|nr:hypothetical protein [Hyphomicrobium sp.]